MLNRLKNSIALIIASGGVDKAIEVVRISISSAQDGFKVRQVRPQILYVASSTPDIGLRQLPRGSIIFCGDSARMPIGCMLSTEIAGKDNDLRPRLIVNLSELNRAGLRFNSRMLRIAKIVR